MARRLRVVLPGQPHLVIQRARGGVPLFDDPITRDDYLRALAEALRETGAALHGYALLRAEARLLVTPVAAADLARLIQGTGRRHVRALNARLRQNGSPWEGRFRSAAIDASTCFVECLRFAEGDDDEPLVSSRAHHIGATRDPLVTDHPRFWALGNTPFEREAAYHRATELPAAANRTEAVRATVLRGLPLGPEPFVRAAGALTGRRTALGKPGRPRRNARV